MNTKLSNDKCPLSKNRNLTLLFLIESVGIDKDHSTPKLLKTTKFLHNACDYHMFMHAWASRSWPWPTCFLWGTQRIFLLYLEGNLISVNIIKTSEGYYTYSECSFLKFLLVQWGWCSSIKNHIHMKGNYICPNNPSHPSPSFHSHYFQPFNVSMFIYLYPCSNSTTKWCTFSRCSLTHNITLWWSQHVCINVVH